jgi:hypothetical protein
MFLNRLNGYQEGFIFIFLVKKLIRFLNHEKISKILKLQKNPIDRLGHK